MGRKALCVGINEFAHLPMSSWLAGCVNDAEDISATLRSRGFRKADTTVLLDGDATKSAVLGRLTDLVEGSKTGDHVVFTFSSHGTQVPDVDGDEDYDHLDEAFACHDLAPKGDQWDPDTVIIDDELRNLFSRIPKGVLVEVLLDTCHSGTGLRRIDQIAHDLLIGRRPRYLPPPTRTGLSRSIEISTAPEPSHNGTDHRGLAELARSRSTKSRPVLFAACKPAQTAADATFGGRANGAFTYLFLKALTDQPEGTRAKLLGAVTAGLKAGSFEQRATLEGPVAAKRAGFGATW
ncbi:MAG: caspase family protein [Intrasporangium sp.]|uniref:caspase family protein n=1 Tax=Intrasporangium sp. TaxID=1925024 RepID=UPI0026485B9F|nr:caspase family protein [Intrasporangium sp.]MDN5795094.1 caspase family protein [Intrasporangium sp.]